MRGFRAMLIAVIVLGAAGLAGAAGPRTLTKTGDLYTVATVANQVVVTTRYADGTVSSLVVPQSAGAVESSLQVGVDPATDALFVLWQRWEGMDARIRLAAYVDGTWLGPWTVAGNDGTAAFNPHILMHRSVSTFVDDSQGDPGSAEGQIETSFLHLVWWNQASETEPGSAHYAALPLRADGVPQLNELEDRTLSDLLPYGTVCPEVENVNSLKHPRLFIDPQTGNPHVFFTDFEGCAFQIMELHPDVVDDADEPGKRRRQIIILRHQTTVGIRQDLNLAAAKFDVGANLSIVAYWDRDDSTLSYLQMNRAGISATKTLQLDDTLNHEQAVELIQALIN